MLFLLYIFLINLIAFAMYGGDKRKAKKDAWRIPEHRLMLVAWLGGALGALIGMRYFHHKTLHWRFRLGVPLALIVWMVPVGSVSLVYAMQSGKVLFTPLMIRRSIEAHRANKPYTKDYQWVPYQSISPHLVRAVVASEDNLFVKHNGFSERAIRQAWEERHQYGHVKHGGSTISQQTAKNVFTFGRRTWFRKARETWYTILIEHIWSKQRIMEVYLNVIEMGNGIYGAEAASRRYFGHSAARLSYNESALLAACLPSPRKYSVTRPGPYMQRRQQQILYLMPKMGGLKELQ